MYLVSSWLHFAYLTSGFLLQNTLTLNWKIKVKQVQKKDGGYKVQQYKILPSFSCKSQVKSRLLKGSKFADQSNFPITWEREKKNSLCTQRHKFATSDRKEETSGINSTTKRSFSFLSSRQTEKEWLVSSVLHPFLEIFTRAEIYSIFSQACSQIQWN